MPKPWKGVMPLRCMAVPVGKCPAGVPAGPDCLLGRRGGAAALRLALGDRQRLEALALARILALAFMVARLAVGGALAAVDAVAMDRLGLVARRVCGADRGEGDDSGGSGDTEGCGVHDVSPGVVMCRMAWVHSPRLQR